MRTRRFNLVLLAMSLFVGSQMAFAQQAAVETTGNSLPANLAPPKPAAVEAYNAGVTLMQANKPVEAAEKFRRSIEVAPDFPNAHCNLGTALLLQGDAAGALPELQKSVQLNPKLAAAWATLGSCYQAVGRTKDGLDSFNKYLEIAPNGDLAPKVRALSTAINTEFKRAAGITQTDVDDYFPEATYGGLARWKSMPILVYIKPGAGVPGFKPEFTEILQHSFSEWEKASAGKVTFQYITDPIKAQIACVFTNSLQNAITAAEGGHTVIVPDSKGNILKADMSLLTIPLTGTELNPNYAHRVYLHEIGHAMGILGHSKNPDDIMFASVLPANKEINLTDRDTKTICLIYSDEALTRAKMGIDTSKLTAGDPNSKTNRVLALNNEARSLMEKKNYMLALQKLEEALKLDPTDQVLLTNVGSIYGNLAAVAFNLRNFPLAEMYYKKAIPLLERGTAQMNLGLILTNYGRLLHVQNRTAEAAKIDARLSALGMPPSMQTASPPQSNSANKPVPNLNVSGAIKP